MTHDQHIASDPEISVWVSASAGTGKTKVLTDRVLRLLLSGAPPARILCITYTRAAAAEMESRISRQLAAWVTLDDDSLKAALRELTGTAPDVRILTKARRLFAQVLDAAQRIRIQTFHSFCQSVLLRFPLEAEVPPNFTAIDDITARELLAKTKATLFADMLKPGHRDCAEAVAALATHMSETSLHGLIARIVEERRKFTHLLMESDARERLHEALGISTDLTHEALIAAHMRYSPEEESDLRQASKALSQSEAKTDFGTFTALSEWLEARTDIVRYAQAYVTQKGTRREKLFTNATLKHWPRLGQVLAAEQQRVLAYCEARKSLFIAEMSRHVTVLASSMLGLYQRIKATHGYLDYDDLIFYTVRLFTRPDVAPWVLYKLDGGIDHLLVDEAQDTTPEQWKIVNTLASEFFAGESARSLKRTLFVVGDEKQSIYSFQGAEPAAFDTMQRGIAKLALHAGQKFVRVRLERSFRSTEPVLAAVDSVFAQADARDGLIFGEGDIRHEVNRIKAAGRVELWPLTENPQEEALPEWHVADATSYTQRADVLCAGYIAETIANWVVRKRMLASQGRPVAAGDILILVQRRGGFARAMLRALKRRNIAVAGADRLVLTHHIVVQDCLALARFLLLPQDDLTLAELLRSPFIGLSEEALFELAYQRGEHSLWQRLKGNKKYSQASDFLSDVLAKVDYLPPYELFAYVLETQAGRRKLAVRLSQEIDDPLNEFLSLALHYGTVHPPSLQGFLHWLESGEIAVKRDMEMGRDEVRILTVHGAKGLQAPIVFLPDTVRMPVHESGLLWTQGETPLPLFSPSADAADMHYGGHRKRLRTESEREYRRLLYVAMTRAEDELYICGWKSGKAPTEHCWYELVKRAAESWQTQEDKRILVNEEVKDAASYKVSAETVSPVTLPEWAGRAAAQEPTPARPLAPSRLEAETGGASPLADVARERGILAHRLLQYLPDVPPNGRAEVAERFMHRYGTALTLQEREQLVHEVSAILDDPQFAPVFGPESVAEASVAGIAGGEGAQVVAGRIDRLAVLPQGIYLIDYKTGYKVPATVADIPMAYLRQVDAYRQLIQGIYPGRPVICGLLWTAGPKLLLVPDTLPQYQAA